MPRSPCSASFLASSSRRGRNSRSAPPPGWRELQLWIYALTAPRTKEKRALRPALWRLVWESKPEFQFPAGRHAHTAAGFVPACLWDMAAGVFTAKRRLLALPWRQHHELATVPVTNLGAWRPDTRRSALLGSRRGPVLVVEQAARLRRGGQHDGGSY